MIMIKTFPSMVASIETAKTSDQQVCSNIIKFIIQKTSATDICTSANFICIKQKFV